MIPPDKQHLQALAGWALSVRHDGSDQQQLAVRRFGDGCASLSEVIEELPVFNRKLPELQPQQQPTSGIYTMPKEVQEAVGVTHGAEGCRHKFDIRTQRCHYCGRTYMEVMKRRPELF